MFNNFFSKTVLLYNIVERGRPQVPIRCMRIACCIPKATDTHWEYVILIAFSLQHWLQERASTLHDTYSACLVKDQSVIYRELKKNTNTANDVLRTSVNLRFQGILYSEGPATGHLDTGFSWFPCVYKQMLRWFSRFQIATTCFHVALLT